MSSIVERLTEGIVNRDMRAEGNALLSKWERTGLLEGLDSDRQKGSMARLLENQAKELLREASALHNGDVEGFAAVAFPIVRRVFAGLIANDLVSVQPMSLPSGLIFFLDFTYSADLAGGAAPTSRMGNTKDKSIYGTDRVGSEVTGGVNLLGTTNKEDLGGPRTTMGYSYSSPTGSSTANDAGVDHVAIKGAFTLNGSVSDAHQKLIEYDPDLLASTDSTLSVFVVDVEQACMSQADYNNMGAFVLPELVNDTALSDGMAEELAALGTVGAITVSTTEQIRRLTRKIDDTNEAGTGVASVRFVLVSTVTAGHDVVTTAAGSTGVTLGGDTAAGMISFPINDNITTGGGTGAVVGAATWGLEGTEGIPEIDIKVDSIAITAQTKKLKAK